MRILIQFQIQLIILMRIRILNLFDADPGIIIMKHIFTDPDLHRTDADLQHCLKIAERISFFHGPINIKYLHTFFLAMNDCRIFLDSGSINLGLLDPGSIDPGSNVFHFRFRIWDKKNVDHGSVLNTLNFFKTGTQLA
jgi:hypothetical protein